MTINKSKGFTLIELLVVISIIGLLSSIVLASIKSAREKAMITKTVAEMKSLQNALELYKNQYGDYPGNIGQYYDDDDNVNPSNRGCVFGCNGGFNTLIQNELVTKKFITKIPNSPFYPNNCTNQSCWANGYTIGYARDPYSDPNSYALCGGQKINNYYLFFWANDKKLNLPTVQYYDYGSLYNLPDIDPPYIYCLSM